MCYLQDYILSQDPVGDMTLNQWEELMLEMSQTIEPKDAQPKRVVCELKLC